MVLRPERAAHFESASRGVGRFNCFCRHSLEMGQLLTGSRAAAASRAVFTKAVALTIQTKPLADAHLGAVWTWEMGNRTCGEIGNTFEFRSQFGVMRLIEVDEGDLVAKGPHGASR